MALFQEEIPLAPAGGGVCIDIGALQPADIIVSTTRTGFSPEIRLATMSVVSHAAIYAGDSQLIEAVPPKVTKRALYSAIADDTLAVAYRHPKITAASAQAVIAYANLQVGKPYSTVGAAIAGMPPGPGQLLLCSTVGSNPASFFCSQLVLGAYRRAGLPLTALPPGCVTPGGLARVAIRDLKYVGHLKGSPSMFPIVTG